LLSALRYLTSRFRDPGIADRAGELAFQVGERVDDISRLERTVAAPEHPAQAPSWWDGVDLDVPDHGSNMADPVYQDYRWICPADHPVAVPMVEFKIHFKVSRDMSQVRFSSGRGLLLP
jgi:hypothetical protein